MSILRTTRNVLGLCFLLTISVPAVAADQMTLADLRQMCATSDEVGKSACRFYIYGVFEGLTLAGSADSTPNGLFKERSAGKQFCVPEGMSQSAMVQRVLKMADADVKAYPADAKMPAVSFISGVIVTSYPCR